MLKLNKYRSFLEQEITLPPYKSCAAVFSDDKRWFFVLVISHFEMVMSKPWFDLVYLNLLATLGCGASGKYGLSCLALVKSGSNSATTSPYLLATLFSSPRSLLRS